MMVKALQTELITLLEKYIQTGEEGIVDLRSLPMSPQDLIRLEDELGKGEVSASVDVTGLTKIWETQYAGVWWIRSFADADVVTYEQIVVCAVPELLKAHPDDISASISELRNNLNNSDEKN